MSTQRSRAAALWPSHMVGLLAALSFITFFGLLTAAAMNVCSSPRFESPVSPGARDANADPTGLSALVLVPHAMIQEFPDRLAAAGHRLGWTFTKADPASEKTTVVNMPAQDSHLLQNASVAPHQLLAKMEQATPAPAGAPAINVNLQWNLQNSPQQATLYWALIGAIATTAMLTFAYFASPVFAGAFQKQPELRQPATDDRAT